MIGELRISDRVIPSAEGGGQPEIAGAESGEYKGRDKTLILHSSREASVNPADEASQVENEIFDDFGCSRWTCFHLQIIFESTLNGGCFRNTQ